MPQHDTIRITPGEIEAVLDRLSAPDSLANAFTDTHPDDPPSRYTFDEVETTAWKLHEEIRQSRAIPANLSDLEVEILVDCIKGSTYPAKASNLSDQKARAAWNSLYNLAGKFNQFLGTHIQPGDIPAY